MRKEEAQLGIEYKPKYFNVEKEDGKKVYKYNGEYFKRRKAKDWTGCAQMF